MKEKIRIRKKAACIMALCLSAALIFSGCSSAENSSVADEPSSAAAADNSSAAADNESASGDDASAALEDITSQLAPYSGTPSFLAGDFEKLDAKSIIGGKKVFLMCANSTNEYMVGMTERYADLVNFCGGEAFIYYADGTNDSWISGIQTAISQKYDAIDIVGGATIDTLENVIEEANAAGIYIQDTHNADVSMSYNDKCSVGADFKRAMELCALETIRQAGGPDKANVLVIANVGLDSCDNACREGVTEIFDKYGVKYKFVDVSVNDWATNIAEQTRTSLISDSSINCVLAYYDNMLLYTTPVIEELGLSFDDMVIGSFNGSPGILDCVSDGTVDFDLGESVGWIAAHGFDCMLRGLSGMEIHNDLGTAAYMINQDNIANCIDPEVGKASYAYDGVTSVYLDGYSDLWGIDLTGVFDE